MGLATASRESEGRAVLEADILLGEPLPWDVYDGHGNLLLRQGFVMRTARQREALVARGVHRRDLEPGEAPARPRITPAAGPSLGAFDLVDSLLDRLKGAFSALLAGRGDAPARIEQLALDVQAACERAADAVLAALHVNHDGPYGLVHPLHAAILCELVGRRLEVPPYGRLPLVSAALSHDVGILQVQEVLQRQTTPLTEAQWAEVRAHPRRSAELLAAAGVEDPLWIDPVLHHHERLDGSGYPDGLIGDALSIEARLVAVADIYSAMVRPRVYRDALLAQTALRQIFLDRGQKIDATITEVFIKEVGIFPPGALVRLASGEVAVVAGRGADTSHPPVFSLLSKEGVAAKGVSARDSRQAEHAIVEMLPYRRFRALAAVLRGLWPSVPFPGAP